MGGGDPAETRSTTTATAAAPLHSCTLVRRTWLNRAFAAVYGCAVVALLHRHVIILLQSATAASVALLIADSVLAFLWITAQGFRVRPIRREAFPENLAKVVEESDFPAMDVFICTADPYKEPPMSVVNTALSVMAYDYPKGKLSVYVSDDGGSKLTLFAFMEAAKFAAHWLPYCQRKKMMERCPEVYFQSNPASSPETDKIKKLYEIMKRRVEKAVETANIPSEDEQLLPAFKEWTDDFTRQHHPTVIQILLESRKDKDITGGDMPNLVYLSRQKRRHTPHNFKAGALNALLRVSAAMTNAPIILILDCDMYSNDPKTPLRVLCYFLDSHMNSRLAFVQFPQRFRGLNKDDIYTAEAKLELQINASGMDGLGGPNFMGTGCFFRRKALYGPPTSNDSKENSKLSPNHSTNSPINTQEVLSLACHVSSCDFEAQTEWGSKMGFRYGALVEDFHTSYSLHCEGWKSILCHPNRPAFLGDAPPNLVDLLNQTKRWYIGFLQVGYGKNSPINLGFWPMNPFLALCYTHYMYRAFWAIPLTIYSFLPQLALLNSSSIFPKVYDPCFWMYAFLFLGSYAQDLLEFISEGGEMGTWWNSQRMWVIRGLSALTFALGEVLLKSLGITTSGFNLTSKVFDDEQAKRYDLGIYEFGVASPLFLPVTMAAIINLSSFTFGVVQIFYSGKVKEMFLQLAIAGLMVVINWPLYEAIVLRADKGKMPMKITLASLVLASLLYLASSLAF